MDRAALTFALHPIITIDVRGIIQSASNSLQRVFGWTPEELVGKNVSVLMPEPNKSAHDGYIERYRTTGTTSILNRPRRFDALRKDGTVFPIELSVSRADVAGKGVAGSTMFVGIIRDMSEQAAAEHHHELDRARLQDLVTEQTQALQAAHLRLRMADRLASIGTLAAGLGHDMNNVLLPVRARLNALRATNSELPAPAVEHVEEIRKSIAYLQQLADGLHFLAMDPDMDGAVRGGGDTTDLAAWWQQVGPLLAKAVPKHVRVMADIPAKLPEAAVAAHRLTQAVLNLVVNAGEAIPSGRKRREGRVRVWAKLAQDGSSIRLGVTDNGLGMSEEVRRRAFEMFFTTKVRGMGTGLGLALVNRVTASSGGSVELESELGKGTTVVMVLPVAERKAADGAPVAVMTISDGRAAALVRQILESSGARVQEGQNPGRADVWIVDVAAVPTKHAKTWRSERSDGRLVLLGTPAADRRKDWMALNPTTILDPNDFESVRAALGRALRSA